jgi:flagellar biosynthetic protein FliO
MGGVSLKVAGSLMLILGFIAGLSYLLRQIRLRSSSFRQYPEMRLIGTLNLAPKRGLALIEIWDQWLLVGIGTENVNLISRLEPPVSLTKQDTGSEKGSSFLALLQKKGVAATGENLGGARHDPPQ